MTTTLNILDRFRGCMLGLAVGDALGSPFEGIDGYGIYKTFGVAINIVRNPPVDGSLEYTDDTEMMIGLAEALLESGRVDEDVLMAAFARNFDVRRGYGAGAKQIIATAQTGGDWRRKSQELFPNGSFGNGAAMRVAPIGLLFQHDLDRVEREAVLSAQVTHRHPLGIDGARTIALAVAMAAQPEAFDRSAFIAEIYARATTMEFQEAIEKVALAGTDFSPLSLGHGVEAHRSAITAVAIFDQNRDSYEETLSGALRVGGDTDTIAAMAGAISGARLGHAAIPTHLLERLENGTRGRDYIDDLARRMFEHIQFRG
jgi:poly(ADP-ribose) glycohydrolase ARH3